MAKLTWVVACALAALTGCLGSQASDCGDLVCPQGKVCAPAHTRCVLPDQISACAGRADGAACSYPGTPDGVCAGGACISASCGDAIVDTGEQCDQGAANSDAANATCRTDCQRRRCGDGVTDPAFGEACDDGNNTSGDGCSADCRSNERCGNGVVDVTTGETCDDGAANSNAPNAVCRTDCQAARCGDGVVDANRFEQCDCGQAAGPLPPGCSGANTNAPDGACRATCVMRRCGDGIVDPGFGEICDDGNNLSGDGCSFDCKSKETCGNAYTDFVTGEQCDDGDGQSHDGCGLCTLEAPRWQAETIPTVSMTRTVVEDVRRDRLVLVREQETWESRGGRFVLRDSFGRPQRQGGAVAYDARRGVTVLFGGMDDNANVRADTFEWDGLSWRQRTPAHAPPPRALHTLSYDAARGLTLLFGGRDGGSQLLADTWIWDGNDWREVTPAAPTDSPGARYLHAMAYDPKRGRVVLFGGDAGSVLDDTWEWNGTKWEKITPTPTDQRPPPRALASMVFDPQSGRTLLFGGLYSVLGQNRNRADTWTWDGATWYPENPTRSPPERVAASAVHEVRSGRVLLLGGDAYSLGGSAQPLYDMWEWSGTNWSERPAALDPTARESPAFAYDSARGRIVLYGGNGPLFDTWEWNASAWHKVQPLASPTSSLGVATFDEVSKKVVFIDGTDTWLYDGITWAKASASPTFGWWNPIAYDRARGRAVHVAPLDYSTNDDIHTVMSEWDGARWAPVDSWYAYEGRGPSGMNSAMAYDAARGCLVLFGGMDVTTGIPLAETWERCQSGWTHRQPAISPVARTGHAMVYNAARGRVMLFGDLDDRVWEWTGSSWQAFAPPSPPPARQSHGMAYDAATGEVVVFGGMGGGIDLGDTWTFRFDAPIREETCLGRDSDGDTLDRCADPDCAGLCARCGDGVADPVESCWTCPADVGPCADVCGDFVCGASETVATCPGDCTP